MRIALTTGLVLVWSIPVIVAVDIWRWMVDYEFGVANWSLQHLHVGNFVRHDWFANPWTGFGVITALIVWGAIPFITITIYASARPGAAGAARGGRDRRCAVPGGSFAR